MSSLTHQAIVIGAGPGGLATLAGLCDASVKPILWVDKSFNGGRLNTLYREISSNTKIRDYLGAIYSSPTCSSILQSAPVPNAVTKLESMNRDETCVLEHAGEMVCMLIEHLLARSEVQSAQEVIEEASLKGDVWTVSTPTQSFITNRLFFCTGSEPRSSNMHVLFNKHLVTLDLDKCMLRSQIPSLLPGSQKSVVAVIGNSHSGILCCKNFHEAVKSKERNIKIINFGHGPLKYAKYVENGIVFDNTGLKGTTAEWAKEVMENDSDQEMIEKLYTSQDQESLFREYLPKCTHIVYAIGYTPSPLPRVYIEDKEVQGGLEFDMDSSGFYYDMRAAKVPGLYGNGIAFPEKVEDPEGHVEAAVGLAKFFAFAARKKELWLNRG